MRSFEYTLKDPMGLHVRPAGLLAKEAKKYQSKITVTAKGETVEVQRLIAVMRLATKGGDTITVSAEGPDEDPAITELQKFLQENC